jgi:tuftelin-interacting protein 11
MLAQHHMWPGRGCLILHQVVYALLVCHMLALRRHCLCSNPVFACQLAHCCNPSHCCCCCCCCYLPHIVLLQELVLNPLAPQLQPFHWAMAWHGLLPTGHLAALLESSFFPAWHALLHHWLSHTPNYDEVTRWYLEWKGMFPQDLLDHPRVRAGFSTALNMMNSAADGQPLPAAAPAAAGPVPSWRAELGGDQPAAVKPLRGAGAAAAEPSFKDLVARYAEEQGLEFVPRAGRLHDGLQVYSFGGVSCVVDAAHSLVRAQLKDRGWAPVSLEKLRQEAAARRGS